MKPSRGITERALVSYTATIGQGVNDPLSASAQQFRPGLVC